MEYVEERNGGYYVTGTRLSLDSVVYSFRSGDSPETIRQNFPSLSLEQVYGAITYYLHHQEQVDACILQGEAEFEKQFQPLSHSSPALFAKLQRAREQMAGRRS